MVIPDEACEGQDTDAVEGKRSLQDRPKALHYAENKQRFARFASKIIHVALDRDPQDKARYRWPVSDTCRVSAI